MRVLIEAEVLGQNEGTLLVKILTGFGDPEMRVVKENTMRLGKLSFVIKNRIVSAATEARYAYYSCAPKNSERRKRLSAAMLDLAEALSLVGIH